ncbi:MAG: hypothetical protein IPP19_00950 [Verrucomicrobia bacterium]|nr:hypothetical protein [Verrucomicrobiota bacterium]
MAHRSRNAFTIRGTRPHRHRRLRQPGWIWKDAPTSLNWGGAPFLIEIIPGEIELPVAASRVKAWALSGEGTRLDELPITDKSGRTVITLGTVGNTLWYEVQISAVPVPPPVFPAPEPTTSSNTGGGGAVGFGCLFSLILLSFLRTLFAVRKNSA